MIQDKKGFSTPIGIVIILAITVMVGAGAWYFGQSRVPESSPNPSPSATPSPTPTPTPTPNPSPSVSEEPYIKVISPNGGETLTIGENYEIRWESEGVDEIGISLQPKEGAPVDGYIALDAKASQGSYLWTVPDMECGEYKFYIMEEEKEDVQMDASDNYFSIVQSDETADWEIYTNEEYGFQVKYPGGCIASEIPPSSPTGIEIVLDEGAVRVQEIDDSMMNIDLPEDCMFKTSALQEDNMLSYVKTETINGISFYYYKNYPEYLSGYCGMSMGCLYKDVYRTLIDDNCYEIVYERYDNSEISELFNQILSTFEFID